MDSLVAWSSFKEASGYVNCNIAKSGSLSGFGFNDPDPQLCKLNINKFICKKKIVLDLFLTTLGPGRIQTVSYPKPCYAVMCSKHDNIFPFLSFARV